MHARSIERATAMREAVLRRYDIMAIQNLPRSLGFRTSVCRRIAQASSLICLAVLTLCDARIGGTQTPNTPVSTLTLQMVFDSLRIHHPSLLAAESYVRAAQGGLRTARTFANPVIGYQVDQTPFPGAGPVPGMMRQAMTTATFPLEFIFQRAPKIARANAELRKAGADASTARQRLGLNAAAAFYRTALGQVQVATMRDLAGWLDTLVMYNRARVKEGATAEADLIRSELERDRVGAEESMQSAELAQARAELNAFVSADYDEIQQSIVLTNEQPMAITVGGSLTNTSESAAIATTHFEQTLSVRPDVRSAREHLNAATAGVSIERSMVVRQLGATIGTMQTNHTNSMIAGLSLPVPLFDQNRGDVQRASAEREAAAFELSARQRAAWAELRGAYDAARILTERMSTLARVDSANFLARADESRRIALGAYREGAIPLYQVIDAARVWSDARSTYYRTLFAQHQSALSLIVAQGLDILTAANVATISGGTSR